ncbi:MAG: hypothetical protein IJP63_07215 [Acholeplasmatales bacterium]|nr:hypothetical protein [Acholeplasmatales bacterium]
MKKKFLLTGTALVAGAAIVGLVSCGSGTETVKRTQTKSLNSTHHYVEAPTAPTYDSNGGEVDVFINYSGTSGVTRAENKGPVNDPITGASIGPGTLLPTWRAFQSYTGTTIKEATDYTQTSDKNVWTAVATGGKIMSQTDSSRNVDLFYGATNGNGFQKDYSYLTPLESYINTENPSASQMPYFSQYLKDNPAVKKTLTINGHIYYTPYFDGVDDIERMLLMDTSLTKKVLDSTSGWDTTTTNGGSNPSANVVQGGFYKPFMDATNNYPDAETSVPVLFEGKAYTVKIKQVKNIVAQQNELLANGCTGQALAEQFIAYIREAYSDLFEHGYYENPSDLFVSDSAAYNPDELIALMRVVKANPGMITGDANDEINVFFPRACSNNRVENIYDLTQIWGVQGVDGEQGNFYVGGDNKIHALETTQASYDALDYLSQIYDEGLIMKDFYALGTSTDQSTGWLNKYFKKITEDAKYGFMMFDYAAANGAANDMVDGVGTKQEDRKNGFGDKDAEGNFKFSQTGITAILAPLTYWADGQKDGWTPTQGIADKTGKSLLRYYESNRALKTNSWAIPVNADNIPGALRLMDIMFSPLGQIVNNYGPTEYWAKPDTSKGDTVDGTYDATKAYVSDDLYASGELNPIISAQVKASLINSGKDFWSYSREYLGSTHGIGNIRPMGVNAQATNAYAQMGVSNIQNAFTVGNNGVVGDGTVLKLATITKKKTAAGDTAYCFATSVPTGFTKVPTDDGSEWEALSGFWGANKAKTNVGWVNAVTRGHNNDLSGITVYSGTGTTGTTYAKVLEQREVFNKKCLYGYARSITGDETYVPSYAKATA